MTTENLQNDFIEIKAKYQFKSQEIDELFASVNDNVLADAELNTARCKMIVAAIHEMEEKLQKLI
jgi:hypothetical protein